jgi:hypothetical protein
MYQTSFKFYDLEPVQLELDFDIPENHVVMDNLSYSFSYTLPSDENWNRQLIYSSIMNNYDKT